MYVISSCPSMICLKKTNLDVAEDNIEPVRLTREILYDLFTKRATFSRYFINVDGAGPDGNGGRLVMSEELQRRYPEDDEAAKAAFANTIPSQGAADAINSPIPVSAFT